MQIYVLYLWSFIINFSFGGGGESPLASHA